MRIYVAGSYTRGDQVQNIRAAVDVAEALVAKGHVPYIPHLNAFWHLMAPHPAKFWYTYDLEWLKVCDAVLRLPGNSVGADAEVAYAKETGKPVFCLWEDVPTHDPS